MGIGRSPLNAGVELEDGYADSGCSTMEAVMRVALRVLLFCAIATSVQPGIAAEDNHEQARTRDISAIEKIKGRVDIDKDAPERPGDGQILADLKSRGAEIRTNAILADTGDDVIRYLEVRFRKGSWAASSGVVSSLQRVKQNVALHFYGIRLSDDELRRFRGWTNIISVSFMACRIDDGGVQHIATLPKLRDLALQSGGGLTNAALAHFSEHRGLRGIMLEGRGFSDAAVAHLKKMQGLKHINLFAHGFTANGVAELKKSLPGAYISVSEPSFDDPRQTTR
jgi:hypothetical protein